MNDARADLLRAAAGDVRAVSALSDYSDEELAAAGSELGTVEVTRQAVAEVVRGLLSGQYNDPDVQRWASFIRWSYVAGRRPLNALDLEYTAEHEDNIVEVLARLDELGDVVDGELRPGEAEEFLRMLGADPGSTPTP